MSNYYRIEATSENFDEVLASLKRQGQEIASVEVVTGGQYVLVTRPAQQVRREILSKIERRLDQSGQGKLL
jgi:hypothetical protein